MSRRVVDLNSGWRFSRLPHHNGWDKLPVTDKEYDTQGWEQVTLPHTWNAEDGASGRTGLCEGGEHYYRGLACYRKSMFFEADKCRGRRVFIEFGAANTVAGVYVNGNHAGSHEGGYSAFRFDITDLIEYDSVNSIAVTVSNAPTDHIAPITDQGDFTKMGGLYRGVRLIITDPVHIDLMDYGSSGIYVSADSGSVGIKVCLANDCPGERSVCVSAEILDEERNHTASCCGECEVGGSGKASIELSTELRNPVMWDGRKNPYLYTARITVSCGEMSDSYEQSFGVRALAFDSEKGFFLNGCHLDLHGVNYHQDSYENGWAMTDEQRKRDYLMMMDMGCSSVRMAHYQHDRYEYELCDRYGITVWTEIGIVNRMAPGCGENMRLSEGFAENVKQQLTELIRQNYNHPSVIVWGISNELHQMSDEIFDLYCELYDLARREDPGRCVVFADNQFCGRYLDLPADVVGYNRYFGWYRDAGPVEKYGPWLDECHEKREKRPLCVSEYGAGGAVTQYMDNVQWPQDIDPWGERHYENYQSVLHEEVWKQLAAREYLWGKYVWCMFDFASDGREEGDTKGVNDKGLVTRKRIPKDTFYFYRSIWSKEPTVHLNQKSYTPRPYMIPQVKAYSNGTEAELLVNGQTAGRLKQSDNAAGLPTVYIWKNVEIVPGYANQIEVRAVMPDGTVYSSRAVWEGC